MSQQDAFGPSIKSTPPDEERTRLDPKAIDAIRMLQVPGRENLVEKMIRVYLTRTQELMHQLRQASAEGDCKVFHRAAHSLKSNSGTIGAVKVAQIAKELESMSRNDHLERPEQQFAALAHEVALVQELLLQQVQMPSLDGGRTVRNSPLRAGD